MFGEVPELTPEQKERESAHALAQTADDLREAMSYAGIMTADGCVVEPDGVCPHGFRSPLIVLRLI